MSTITRERLEELAAGQSGLNLRIATHEESQKLARIALASLEAEPVAWISERNLKNLGKSYSVYVKHEPVMTRPIPLYTAPPAPPAPDAYIRDEHRRMMLNGKSEPKIGFADGWNACRDTMLQGADGNLTNEGAKISEN